MWEGVFFEKIGVGFVGCGCISPIYLKNLTNMFREVEIVGVCDLIRERAEKAAAEYNVPKIYEDMYELFRDPDVDIVLNITRPCEHYEVTKQALLHGKHVYSEKPLSPDLNEARELVALAAEKNLFTTFDVTHNDSAILEIYGSEGTIFVPDPDFFGGEVLLQRIGTTEKISMPLIFDYPENSRGLGLADMAKALTTGRDHRANCHQQLHVVEVMSAVCTSSQTGKAVAIESPFERKPLMKTSALTGILYE